MGNGRLSGRLYRVQCRPSNAGPPRRRKIGRLTLIQGAYLEGARQRGIAMRPFTVLTDEQVHSFLDNGYLVVKDCLDLTIARRWIDQAYERLGYDPQAPSTWEKDIVWMDHQNKMPIRDIAPKAWAAILAVVGGQDRLETQVMGKPKTHFSS